MTSTEIDADTDSLRATRDEPQARMSRPAVSHERFRQKQRASATELLASLPIGQTRVAMIRRIEAPQVRNPSHAR